MATHQTGEREYPVTPAPQPYQHPKTVADFEALYRKEYVGELADCDGWIEWCKALPTPDWYGINFHQGRRSALVYNNIKMHQLLRILKGEAPNA